MLRGVVPVADGQVDDGKIAMQAGGRPAERAVHPGQGDGEAVQRRPCGQSSRRAAEAGGASIS